MIKKGSEFFQNAKFCPILDIYNLPDDQRAKICMNCKFVAFVQPVIVAFVSILDATTRYTSV